MGFYSMLPLIGGLPPRRRRRYRGSRSLGQCSQRRFDGATHWRPVRWIPRLALP